MKCPVCGSESYAILKSKKEFSKSAEIEKLILKCNQCQTVFREELRERKPVKKRIIISEHEKSFPDQVELYPDLLLKVGDVIPVSNIKVEINSMETKKGSRVQKSVVDDIETIWVSSLDTPARVGISVDFRGEIFSRKVEVERDYRFTIGDLVKLNNLIFQIKSFKTLERKMRKGSASAEIIKRIYGRPVESMKFDHDLSKNIVTGST